MSYDVVMAQTNNLIGFPELADMLGIGVPSARAYHAKAKQNRRKAAETGDQSHILQGDLPEPDHMFGQSPAWKEATIRAWVKKRPGKGNHTSVRVRRKKPADAEQ